MQSTLCEHRKARHALAPDLWIYAGEPAKGLAAVFFVAAFAGSRAWGPGFGGCRDWSVVANPTVGPDVDAQNLACGMRRKAVLMGYAPNLDGGKSVVVVEREQQPTPIESLTEDERRAVLYWMADRLNELNGGDRPVYILAEDMGIKPADMAIMAERTPWVAGLPGLSGDPSPWTARGCVAALEAVAQQMPDFSLERARFGVVGLGSTGFGSSQSPGMVRLLAQRYPAATFVGWDSDQEYFRRVLSTGLVACCQDVFTADIDALLLCGPSGMLMPETVERLSSSVRLIGGSANVQCSDPLVDAQLLARGIVRLPEELANGAGARIVGAEAFLTRCYMVGIRDDGGTYDPAGRMTFVAERFDLQEVGAETLAYIGQQSALRFREVLGARTGRTSLPVHTIQSARVSIARLSPAIDVSPKEF